MKAQRRHELQTNTLAQFLSDLPLYLRFHFGKILLGVLIAGLLVLLVRSRMSAGQQRLENAISGLNEARRIVFQIPVADLSEQSVSQRASIRLNNATRAEELLDEVLADTSDPDDSALRAETHIARGDLFWTLANLPRLPAATTQPALDLPRSAEQYLKQAEDAYNTVLVSYRDRPIAVATARFGLAAIAENRGQWDAARAQYDTIINQKDLAPMARQLAAQRLAYLPRYAEPLFMGTVTSQPTTAPETIAAPSQDDATTMPATQPAADAAPTTQDAAPTTRPASVP